MHTHRVSTDLYRNAPTSYLVPYSTHVIHGTLLHGIASHWSTRTHMHTDRDLHTVDSTAHSTESLNPKESAGWSRWRPRITVASVAADDIKEGTEGENDTSSRVVCVCVRARACGRDRCTSQSRSSSIHPPCTPYHGDGDLLLPPAPSSQTPHSRTVTTDTDSLPSHPHTIWKRNTDAEGPASHHVTRSKPPRRAVSTNTSTHHLNHLVHCWDSSDSVSPLSPCSVCYKKNEPTQLLNRNPTNASILLYNVLLVRLAFLFPVRASLL
jgi:hypothetical protein